MTSNELTDTQNGFVTVSDFYAHQHESIVNAMKNSEIPHQIEFHPHKADALWREGAFRVYVAPEHLEAARNLCKSIEFAPEAAKILLGIPIE
ncbi:hypothetical protein [Microcoleus sp. N9_A1]|uniref:hypothetical protein n=1 Tax=Microcoleus sp. N9_A1 TaxID=3055380 RepID=UPI002FD65DDB